MTPSGGIHTPRTSWLLIQARSTTAGDLWLRLTTPDPLQRVPRLSNCSSRAFAIWGTPFCCLFGLARISCELTYVCPVPGGRGRLRLELVFTSSNVHSRHQAAASHPSSALPAIVCRRSGLGPSCSVVRDVTTDARWTDERAILVLLLSRCIAIPLAHPACVYAPNGSRSPRLSGTPQQDDRSVCHTPLAHSPRRSVRTHRQRSARQATPFPCSRRCSDNCQRFWYAAQGQMSQQHRPPADGRQATPASPLPNRRTHIPRCAFGLRPPPESCPACCPNFLHGRSNLRARKGVLRGTAPPGWHKHVCG